jgi:hypothetical protein
LQKADIDLSFLGLMISVVVCSILLFAFLRVMIQSYNSSRTIGNTGTIQTGEYIQVNRASIDWGVLSPAENKTESIIVSNTAPVKLQLQVSTNSWNPSNASDYLSLTWNYSGSPVAAKASVPIALTLHVDPYISGIQNFTFNILISGNQV